MTGNLPIAARLSPPLAVTDAKGMPQIMYAKVRELRLLTDTPGKNL
jgi:hypothetical protein